MKFIHLSDLHIGKRMAEYSLIDDQQYILSRIIDIIKSENPDAVLIAGDIYDKSVPSAEAVSLFDSFITRLAKMGAKTFIISGNHDSPERIDFASHLMDVSGIHVSGVYDGDVKPYVLTDEYGELNVYLLPFVKPVHVRRWFDDEIESYTDAVRVAIEKMNIDANKRNILVTHQFVTGATRFESEEVSVGGSDNIDVSVFDSFDYVALGHIHGPQNCSSERVRYCGTPLKYSFSEARDEKSVTVAELGKKGELIVRTMPLVPKRDMVEIKGKYNDIMQKSFYDGTTYTEDYTHITLTDEEEVMDAIAKLRTVYHNIAKLDYDNTRTRTVSIIDKAADVDNRTPLELFSDLYYKQNNQPMTDEQTAFVSELIESIWEDER